MRSLLVPHLTEARKKDIEEWENSNDAANGAIALRLPEQIRSNIMRPTAKETWEAIEAQYGTSGAAGLYGIFRDAITFEISGESDTAMPIASLASLFNRLAASGLVISESVKAMILLAALPRSWDGLAMTILAQYDAKNINFNDIVPVIQDEYRRRHPSPSTSLASRMSGFKRPNNQGGNYWNNQKKRKGDSSQQGQNLNNSSGHNGNNSEKKKTRRGKGKGKGKPHAHESAPQPPSSVASFATAHIAQVPEFVQGSSTRQNTSTPILENIKKEEQEVDFSDHSWMEAPPSPPMSMIDEEEVLGDESERLIYWQVPFSKLKRNITKQMHRIKQMFSHPIAHAIRHGPNGPYVTHSNFSMHCRSGSHMNTVYLDMNTMLPSTCNVHCVI